MKENTYPDSRVSRYINEHLVPVQLNVADYQEAMQIYHSHWTPCLMLRDVDNVEYRRSYGALNPVQILAELAIARGLRFLHSGQYEKSLQLFEEAHEYTQHDPHRHPENYYWQSVALYRTTHVPDDLGKYWEYLHEMYPDSDWAKKTAFWFETD